MGELLATRQLETALVRSTHCSLAQKIENLKRTSFFTDKLYQLPKTGFLVQAQTEKLQSNFLTGEMWTQRATNDIRDYCVEYVMKKTYLPIDAKLAIINEKKRLVSSDEYGNAVLSDLINPNERNGVVKDSIIELEKLLAEAPDGVTVVRTSPMGWNGYTNAYEDTQTQVYYKENNQIFAFGLRTKMSLAQNEELLSQLGRPLLTKRADLDQYKRICEITGENAVTTLRPQDIIELVQQISGNRDANGNTFDQIWQDFSSRVSYKHFPAKIQSNIHQFQEYARAQFELFQENSNQYTMDEFITNLQMAIAITLLQIIKLEADFDVAYKTDNQRLFAQSMDHFYQRPMLSIFVDALAEMQKLGGCAGGGSGEDSLENELNFIKTPFGYRSILSKNSGEKWDYHEGECNLCHKKPAMVGPCNICVSCEKELS